MKINKEYSGRFVLRIPRFLHSELSKAAQRERVSLNQYCVYILSRYFSSQSLLSMFKRIDKNIAKAKISPAKIEKTIQEVIREVRKEEKEAKK